MKSYALVVTALLLASASGCGRDEAPPPAPSAAQAAAAAASTADSAQENSAVAVKEDYEAQAKQLVNASNLERAVDDLEKEIDAKQ